MNLCYKHFAITNYKSEPVSDWFASDMEERKQGQREWKHTVFRVGPHVYRIVGVIGNHVVGISLR